MPASSTPMSDLTVDGEAPLDSEEDREALIEREGARTVAFGLGADLARTCTERVSETFSRKRAMFGFVLCALCLALAVHFKGKQLFGFTPPAQLVGLQTVNGITAHSGCLKDEEMYDLLCYMKCSILTAGKAPFRTGSTSCCETNNLLCAFLPHMQTQAAALQIGGGKSPITQMVHAPQVGGTCNLETEEPLSGLCYKKCSLLTDGKSPHRVGPTACCAGSMVDCGEGRGTMSGSSAFQEGVHTPVALNSQSMGELDHGVKLNVEKATCKPDEDEWNGICYQSCSSLTENEGHTRTGPEACCKCTSGPFQPVCCMWPFNILMSPAYNVGAKSGSLPHPPGFSVGCGHNEEEYEGLCYVKCDDITDGKMPYRQGPLSCCKYPAKSACTSEPDVLSTVVADQGGREASGVPHGPYIRPDATMVDTGGQPLPTAD